MNKTDIDRLHRVVVEKPSGRGCGRTFAACHNAAGLFETTPENAVIVWLVPRAAWTRHVIPMLIGVLREHEIYDYHWDGTRLELTACGKKLLFVTPMMKYKIRGYLPRYVVEDYGEAEDWAWRQARPHWWRIENEQDKHRVP